MFGGIERRSGKKVSTTPQAKCKSWSKVVCNCLWYTEYGTCLQDRMFFVMEYISGGDLKDLLDKVEVFSEKRTQFYAAEITLAVQFLHQNGILHR